MSLSYVWHTFLKQEEPNIWTSCALLVSVEVVLHRPSQFISSHSLATLWNYGNEEFSSGCTYIAHCAKILRVLAMLIVCIQEPDSQALL